jgi:acetyl-CoA synthetase
MGSRDEEPCDEVRESLGLYGAPQANVASLLCDRHSPEAIAYTIVGQDLSSADLTYGDLQHESTRLANAFWTIGLRPGDRIGTLMGKSRWYIVTVMAIWRIGAVHVPLFTAFAPPAIAFRLSASGCKLVVCDDAQRSKLVGYGTPSDRQSLKIATTGAPDDEAFSLSKLYSVAGSTFDSPILSSDAPLIQIYTSGTTGQPKGVIVPIRALASFNIYAIFGLGLLPGDIFWNAADPGWAYGLYFGVLTSFLTGIRSILLEGGFSPECTLAVLAKFGVTNFAAAPTVYRSLRAARLQAPQKLKLRCASSAGEPLTPGVIEWSRSVLGVPVHDHYGQTELGMVINNHHHAVLWRPLKAGSMGHVTPGWKVAILAEDMDVPSRPGEIGRLAVDTTQSPLSWFSGYVNDTARDRFSADGRWYLTGDCARGDEKGYYYFEARDDDLIIMAGYRIGPLEVESILLNHPAVSECAVAPGPDEIQGEVLEAFIVLREGYTPSGDLTSQIQDLVRRQFAAHAYPRRVHYLDSLPKTPSGKTQRYVLRQWLQQGRSF